MALFLRHSSRGFALGRSGREVLVFLFFLVISGGFWVFTALNQTYEKELSVPVRLKGVPDNIITDGVNDTLRVMVRDKGFAFLDYTYGRKVRPIEFDFKNHSGKDGKGTISSSEIQKQLATVLFTSTKIVSVKPDRIDFIYDKGISKKVPIRLAGDMKAAENYYIAHSQIVPQMATVYALKSILDDINYVTTERIDRRDFVDSVVVEAKLKKIRGVKIVPEKVRVSLYADVKTEQSFEVPITFVNVPDSIVVRTFPTKAEVKFNIGASQYRNVQASQFRVEFDYLDIKDNTDKCSIHLRQSPSTVKNARLTVDEIDYIVESR